jgi:hypothetical protein
MEAGVPGHVRRSSSLTRDGNTLQKPPSFNRSSSINSSASNQIVPANAALQKPPSFKEGQIQAPQEPAKQQQDLAAAWRSQFVEAIEYDSKAAEDGEEPGGALGLLNHFMSIFWKLVNALTPPEWWLGGWPCFWACLVLIIGEVGCCCSRLLLRAISMYSGMRSCK